MEIKSFIGQSEVADLENALGQFIFYRRLLSRIDPGRELYLALPAAAYSSLFGDPVGDALIAEDGLNLVVYHPRTAEIIRWIP